MKCVQFWCCHMYGGPFLGHTCIAAIGYMQVAYASQGQLAV